MAAFAVSLSPCKILTSRPQHNDCPNSTWLGAARASSSLKSTFITGSSGILLRSSLPQHAFLPQHSRRTTTRRSTITCIGGGGFLGVGPAEVVVIVAVGWFLLGPTKLYALAKDSGKLIGELRRTADEARGTFQEALEVELEKEKTEESNDKLTGDETEKPGNELEGEVNLGNPSTNAAAATAEAPPSTNVMGPLPTTDELLKSLSSSAATTGSDSTSMGQKTTEGQATNSQFLDQLKRVSDPNQTALSDIPDLDFGLETEEDELQRLEQQYLAARARVEARKQSSERTKTNSNTNGGENSSAATPVSEQTDSPGSAQQ